MEENDYIISQQKREIEKHNIEMARFENAINSIHLDNKTYINIKQIVKQEIEGILLNPRKLLRIALASLFESSRKHPGKFQVLYYNMSSPLLVEQLLSQSSSIQNVKQYGYGEEGTLLLDEAEQSYNRIVDAITNSCINRIPCDTESTISKAHNIQNGLDVIGGGGDRKIFDTRDLSTVNLVYNNITFQIYQDPEITNQKSSRTDVKPSENEFDIYDFS